MLIFLFVKFFFVSLFFSSTERNFWWKFNHTQARKKQGAFLRWYLSKVTSYFQIFPLSTPRFFTLSRAILSLRVISPFQFSQLVSPFNPVVLCVKKIFGITTSLICITKYKNTRMKPVETRLKTIKKKRISVVHRENIKYIRYERKKIKLEAIKVFRYSMTNF